MPNAFPAIDTAPEDAHLALVEDARLQFAAQEVAVAELDASMRQIQSARDQLLAAEAKGETVTDTQHTAIEAEVTKIERAHARAVDILGRRNAHFQALCGQGQAARAAGYRPRVLAAVRELAAAADDRVAAEAALSAANRRDAIARGVLTEAWGVGFPMPNALKPLGQVYSAAPALQTHLNETIIRRVFAEIATEALGEAA